MPPKVTIRNYQLLVNLPFINSDYMKKVVVILLIIFLVGCGEEKLIFKSGAYGKESEIIVYFEKEKAIKAESRTVYHTKKEAKDEYESLKASDAYLNLKLDGKTITYEQTAYIKGMSKKEVKELFKENNQK